MFLAHEVWCVNAWSKIQITHVAFMSHVTLKMQFQDLVNACSNQENEESPIEERDHPFKCQNKHNEVRNGLSVKSAVRGYASSNSLENAGCSDFTADNENSSSFLSRISYPSEFSGQSVAKMLIKRSYCMMFAPSAYLVKYCDQWLEYVGLCDPASYVLMIQNEASFVIVDKIFNPRDRTPALLIQDDGGGMDPESLRHYMSFGFSEKSKSAIGKYENGFKTSTMRLGADVIVFTRCKGRTLTQSVGLLSYTFLRLTRRDEIVVPMGSDCFGASDGILNKSKDWILLNNCCQWSPYATESELLKQFVDMGDHGTKVIVFNLWLNDDGSMELDFESDKEDILINGASSKVETRFHKKALVAANHIGNCFRHSLRAYLSILYLRKLKDFQIILRGRVVGHHNLADDLKHLQYILYQPRIEGNIMPFFVTTIGFLKEAPKINIHGFNVYHKNRLVLPFWQVLQSSNGTGKGVVGILEANFIEPTHDKQDFEMTSLFHKLKTRLKEMMVEYWKLHAYLIGYQCKKPCKVPSAVTIQSNIKDPSSATDAEREYPGSATDVERERISSIPLEVNSVHVSLQKFFTPSVFPHSVSQVSSEITADTAR